MVYSIQIAVFIAWQFRENCREFQRTNYHLFCVSFLAHCFEAAQGDRSSCMVLNLKLRLLRLLKGILGALARICIATGVLFIFKNLVQGNIKNFGYLKRKLQCWRILGCLYRIQGLASYSNFFRQLSLSHFIGFETEASDVIAYGSCRHLNIPVDKRTAGPLIL